MDFPLQAVNPNPTLSRTCEASEPYSRGQWDSALKATPHSPKGDVSYARALEQTVRSDAHGLRSRRPRSLLMVLHFCRIRVNCSRITVAIIRLTERNHGVKLIHR